MSRPAGSPGGEEQRRRAMARATQRHAFGWLVFANTVGLGLGLLLLWPELNRVMTPLTYGRWMPVHLNGQLYGWCSVPLLGLLFAACLDWRHPHAPHHARAALAAWSLAVAGGAASWLAGESSGKLFMDWSGWARPLLPIAMLVLWTLLAGHVWWRLRRPVANGVSRPLLMGVAVALLALLPLPGIFFWAADPSVYPPVNPGSGGATGASLLGSTLGIVTLFGALPYLLAIPRRAPATLSSPVRPGRTSPLGSELSFGGALIASWIIYGFIDHGHASHAARDQILGLGSLFVWIPLAGWHLSAFAWPKVARRWLVSAYACWSFLVVSGWVTFLPGWSEALKFTHGLVAHAHLAMAGMVTAVNHALLTCLEPPSAEQGRASSASWAFLTWHLGLAVHLLSLFFLSMLEEANPAGLFLSDGPSQALMAVRALSGGAMLVASFSWLKQAWSR
jgi:cytochrome c oxidase cbb3-type subunit 1